jgi:molecular chaperone GrpE
MNPMEPTNDGARDEGADPMDEALDADGADATATATGDDEAARRELAALTDRHLRLAAEFDNYRKRTERERAETWTRSQAELASGLLDVLDDLQRVAHVDADATSVASLLDGVQLVERKLQRALAAAGLEEVAAQDERFDPATMEALMTVDADGPEQDDTVGAVLQKGYRFKGLLLRPARVQVRKHHG